MFFLEPTNLCNLACPHCVTGTGNSGRKKGYMDLSLLERILPINHSIADLCMVNYCGESFLHPALFEILRTIKNFGIKTLISTNGHFLDTNSEQILNSRLDLLIIAIDGVTEESYIRYRIGGSFYKVIYGIEKLIKERNLLRLKTLEIRLQFIIFEWNENEVKDIITFGKKMGVDSVYIKNTSSITQGKKFRRIILKDGSQLTGFIVKLANGEIMPVIRKFCDNPVITWEGQILPCCCDTRAQYVLANVREIDFNNFLHSNLYADFLKSIRLGTNEFCNKRRCPASLGIINKNKENSRLNQISIYRKK